MLARFCLGSVALVLAGSMLTLRPPLGLASQSAQREVALTIDDLPANSPRGDLETWSRITAGILQALDRFDAPAIGFVNEGKLYVEGHLDPGRTALLQDWLDAGLDLGNHTFSHPSLNRTPPEEFQEDLLKGERVIRPLVENARRALQFFRHPFLHTGRDLVTRNAFEAFLREHGYRVAPVSIDNGEWIYARAYDHAADLAAQKRISTDYLRYMEAVFEYYEQQSRALLGYELKQVLLIHANRLNADHLDALLSRIQARGYRFISLEEALTDPAYRSKDEYIGPSGVTWLHRWALTAGKSGDFFKGEPVPPGWVSRASKIR